MKTRYSIAPTRSRRLNEMLGLIVLVFASLFLLALVTYTPSDPSFDTVGGLAQSARIAGVVRPAHNWAGLFGAYLSDALLQGLGAAIFFVPLLWIRTGITWMRSHRVGHSFAKFVGLLLWLFAAPAVFALLPGHLLYKGALPLEGVEGRLLADGLIHVVNLPGAIALVALVVAISLYLSTTFTLLTSREWFRGHFAFVGASRRRLQEKREQRAAVESAPAATTATSMAVNTEALSNDGALLSSHLPAAENTSLLSGLFGIFRRRRALQPHELSITRATLHEENAESQAVWRAMAAPAEPTSASVQAQETAQDLTPHFAFDAVDAARQEPQFAAFETRHVAPEPANAVAVEEDDWLNAPERLVPPPVARAYQPTTAAAEPLPANVMPFPSPAQRVEPVAAPAPIAPMAPPVRPLAPVAAAAASAMVSPMANIADQNIAFGKRADADMRSVAITPKSIRGYKLPPSSLLYRSEEHAITREDELLEEAKVLVEKCGEFGVDGTVTQINPGPVVTTFEFKPDSGVKYSRVTGLADDLCLAMAAESILIERMAGKSTVGVQVPNRERETIWLRDVVECESFAQSKSRLAIALGKDINGRIVTADLASMPHVLIAGSTGSGKSVAINAMIMSVLFKSTPEQVRMILVDPKRVELGMYEGIPHLFTPIITEAKLAANALRNAVKEMERRLKLLAANHVRNIDQFNKLFDSGSEYLFEDVNQEPLPYIMIIIDELADLMMLDRANVEESITRLAQMARAVGIHLVLATQRPSVDVITGLLKANVPTRMSFRLATKIDSRTIIDANGAESLLGRGDMLYLPPGSSRLQRVHAPFVTEKEISAVTAFWKQQGEAEYAEGFLEAPKDEKGNAEGAGANSGEDADPMFDDAVRLVFEFGKASTSLLQRRLRIGYGRAAHLIDMMEQDGLVGAADGSKPRELLKPPSYFSELDAAIR